MWMPARLAITPMRVRSDRADPAGVVVEVAAEDVGRFTGVMREENHVLGRVIDEPELRLPNCEPICVEALADAYNRTVVPDTAELRR